MFARRFLAAALVAALTSACSQTATITRQRGPAYEAKITRSDPTGLYVLGDDGREYRVPAEEVRDIDHPGNVLVVLGGVSLGFAGLLALPATGSNANTDGPDTSGVQMAAAMYGILGVAFLVPGLITWISSKNAAANLRPVAADLPPETLPAAAYPLAR